MRKTSDPVAEWVPIDVLIPWSKNPRINDHAVPAVAKSLMDFGWADVIVAQRGTNRVIGGHTRLKAAIGLGHKEVPVRWVDVTDAQADLLAIALNKTSEIADWDDEKLGQVLSDLKREGHEIEASGFSDTEIRDMMASVEPPPPEDGGVQNVPEKWQIVVDCDDEMNQADLLGRFEAEGLKCRALVG